MVRKPMRASKSMFAEHIFGRWKEAQRIGELYPDNFTIYYLRMITHSTVEVSFAELLALG